MTDVFPAPMPHGPLTEVFPDVFWMQGTVRMGPGMVINRVMVVLRHDGELTVIDAIRPSDPAALDALGRVTKVVKLGMHGMDDPWYRSHYGAPLWAAEGVAGADVVLGPDTAQPTPWTRTFRFERVGHTPELALLLDRGEGVLVTCDAVQNWPDVDGCSFLAKGVTKVFGFTARPAQIGPPWRKRQTPPGGTLKPDFERLLELPFDHLIGGHGKPLIGGAKAALRATVAATFPS
ncbi:MAG: hypothetical protein ABMA64_10680 [Myxococcota bacterium]